MVDGFVKQQTVGSPERMVRHYHGGPFGRNILYIVFGYRAFQLETLYGGTHEFDSFQFGYRAVIPVDFGKAHCIVQYV